MTTPDELKELGKLAASIIAHEPMLPSAIMEHYEDEEMAAALHRQVLARKRDAEAIQSLLARLAKVEAETERLKALVYVPGQWRCAKCKFVLHKMVLCANTGAVGLKGDTKTEPCPNGCGPLWPTTWKEDAFECGDRLEQQHNEIVVLKARAEKAEAASAVLVEAHSVLNAARAATAPVENIRTGMSEQIRRIHEAMKTLDKAFANLPTQTTVHLERVRALEANQLPEGCMAVCNLCNGRDFETGHCSYSTDATRKYPRNCPAIRQQKEECRDQ